MNEKTSKSFLPIELQNLSKVYRGKKGRKVLALDDVSFSVQEGEVFGFLGPNGAGKSTTIKALMGLIRPSNGHALLCGHPASDVRSRKNVGYLPENPAFYDFLTGREYLRFVTGAFGIERVQAENSIVEVLTRLGLADAADRPLRGYSKGMVQRLGLCQTLVHDPEVYVLDEPMSGLDPQGRALVKEIILELKERGKTVFFSTHITNDVEKVCDKLSIIVGGRLQVTSLVDDVLRSGIENYRILAKGDVTSCTVAQPCATHDDEHEFRVSLESLPSLTEEINHCGAVIELVEPVRKDLEKYFLDIVKQASE